MSDELLPPAAARWLRARSSAARLIEVAVALMTGGAVARRVERLDVSMGRADGSLCTLALVRKWGTAAEVTALAAAQAVRPAARAIPELVASGRDGQGRWMITPFYTGRQAGTGAPPAVVFDSLARLHARFRAGRANLMGVPVVDHAWWQRLCQGWAAPLIERCGDRHPAALIRRAVRLLRTAADAPAAAAVLGRLNVTLLHGDVHPGNIIAGTAKPISSTGAAPASARRCSTWRT